MQAVKLGSKKALMIVSDTIKNDIRYRLTAHLELTLNEKKFDILHYNDLEKLKNFPVFTLSTTGNKYWLFLTTYNDRKYCVLMNPKKDQMYLVRYRFDNSLFSDTVLEGEAIKNDKGDKWYFLVSDISVYKGIKIKSTSFSQRQETLRLIMEKEYKPDEALNPMILITKPYLEINYVKHFIEEQIKYIPFKVSGIYFKSEDLYRNDIVYLLDEDKQPTVIKKKEVKPITHNTNIENESNRVLWVNKTDFPDVYEIYKEKNKEKMGFASIPDLKTSQFMNESLENKSGRLFICVWDSTFEKWRPTDLYINKEVTI